MKLLKILIGVLSLSFLAIAPSALAAGKKEKKKEWCCMVSGEVAKNKKGKEICVKANEDPAKSKVKAVKTQAKACQAVSGAWEEKKDAAAAPAEQPKEAAPPADAAPAEGEAPPATE